MANHATATILNPIKQRAIGALWSVAPHLSLQDVASRAGVPVDMVYQTLFCRLGTSASAEAVGLRVPPGAGTKPARAAALKAIDRLADCGEVVPRLLIVEATGLPLDMVDCAIAAFRSGLALNTVLETARISQADAGVIARAIGWTRAHKDDLLEQLAHVDRRRDRRARLRLEEE